MERLTRTFFERPTVQVARELLGAELVVASKGRGIITETEAYVGQNDPACHAARGRTKRTEVMFGPAGYSYIYLIYGMYYCLNVVTEAEGFPAAVLLRGVLVEAVEEKQTNGPGKLCRHFGLSKAQNNMDMTTPDAPLFFRADPARTLPEHHATPRIGIRQGKEQLWRFVMA